MDCTSVSAASDVAVVMVSLLGRLDGEERTAGVPGVAALRRLQLPYRVSEAELGGGGRVLCIERVRRVFRAKAQHFGANGGHARGYGYPPGGAVVGLLDAPRLRVKTLDRRSRRQRRATSLPSWGRCHGARYLIGMFRCSPVASLVFLVLSFLFLICFVRVPLITLYRFGRCGFIYKAGLQPVSSCQHPSPLWSHRTLEPTLFPSTVAFRVAIF